jgi:hypothetical protein
MPLSIKAAASVAIVALGLAGATFASAQTATVASAPAAATPAIVEPSLTAVTLDLGLTADMVARGQQLQTDMVKFGYDEDDVDDWCAGRGDIRNGLVRAGFNDVDIADRLNGFRVRVEALYLSDGWFYSMIVNKCTGEVTRVAPIYAIADIN